MSSHSDSAACRSEAALMGARIRRDGRVLCAALHEAEPGDAYLDDGVHYELSVERRVLVTEPMPKHAEHGQWWWKGQQPDDAEIDPFYLEEVTPVTATTDFGFTIHDVPVAIRDAANDVLRLTIAAEGGRMFPTRKEFETCLSFLARLSDNPAWDFLA